MAFRPLKKTDLQIACPIIQLGAKLGEGGNARVFLGESASLGTVAVKFMLNDNTKRYSRFRDEVKVVTSRLDGSPRVVPILEHHLPESVKGSEVPWYVMPVAKPLMECLAPLTWRERLPILIELADGLAEIHACQVAHRDIKPQNLFGFLGTYRFADFGIASFPEKAALTDSKEPMGPWAYMAPEMLSSPLTADAFRADVYSMAKTIWACLTEEAIPFLGHYSRSSKAALVTRIAATDFVNEPLDSLLERATDSNPDVRPTANEFAELLREVLTLQNDWARANPLQWQAAGDDALRLPGLTQATWTGTEAIARVIGNLSRRHGLNHFFLPTGGGQTVSGAFPCEGGEMLALKIQAGGLTVVKPVSLTLERFADRPDYGYAVLETADASPLGAEQKYLEDGIERLRRVNDFEYAVDDADDYEPKFAAMGPYCERVFKGGLYFIAPSAGIFNKVDDYDGTAAKMGRAAVRKAYEALAEKLKPNSHLSPAQLKRVTRLIRSPESIPAPLELQYIDMAMLETLVGMDDGLLLERRSSSVRTRKDNCATIERVLAGPSGQRLAAQDFLEAMSEEQRAEYLSLVYVGRGDLPVSEVANDTRRNMTPRHHITYFLEKLGNGYMRKAIARAGLQLVRSSGNLAKQVQ